jgi:hypothetical protein
MPSSPPLRPKGTPKTGGRLKGTPNRVTLEVRELAQQLLSRPTYLEALEHRLDTAQLAPAVENQLWQYAFGKPKETLEVDTTMHLPDPRTCRRRSWRTRFCATPPRFRLSATRSSGRLLPGAEDVVRPHLDPPERQAAHS